MAANEAIGLGYGGISKVRLACGLSRKAIAKGIHEIQNGIQPPIICQYHSPNSRRLDG